jgi:hypothetical protein
MSYNKLWDKGGCLGIRLSFPISLLFVASRWALLIHHKSCVSVSTVFMGPWSRSLTAHLQFAMNLRIHAPILRTLRSSCALSSLSSWSETLGVAVVVVKIFFKIFASALLSWQGSRTIFGGHLLGSLDRSRPCRYSSLSTHLLPRLPKSAGFPSVGTWCHCICACSFIFNTQLETNCRYSPWQFIQ